MLMFFLFFFSFFFYQNLEFQYFGGFRKTTTSILGGIEVFVDNFGGHF